jgi:integrase
MRERRRKNRRLSDRPFEIDLMVPGLGAVTGQGDRFRCSAETRDAKVLLERRRMILDLGRRLLHDVLAARLAGRLTTEELSVAYKQGTETLKGLLIDSRRQLLSPLVERWLAVSPVRNKNDYRRQIVGFISYCGGDKKAHVADLTTERIATWLNSLTDGRRGRAGAKRRSASREAIGDRKRRVRKTASLPVRAVSEATRNRHRTAMSAFCTFVVNVAGALQTHPLRGGRLRRRPEPEGRMPYLKPEQWRAYCDILSADAAAPAGTLIVARLLRHTGADVGEVIGYARRDDKVWMPGLLVRDVCAERELPRIRLKRQKVDSSPERFVPYPVRYLPELQLHIKTLNLGPNDLLFESFDRAAFEAAHRRAAAAIGACHLRLKDFRHLAAIAWAQGGVRLERMKEWLGHSTIRLTEIYARFAPDDTFDEPAAENAADVAEGTQNKRHLRAS